MIAVGLSRIFGFGNYLAIEGYSFTAYFAVEKVR
jgi:hypothetical protein